MGLVQQAKDWLIHKLGGYTDYEVTIREQAAYRAGYRTARNFTR